MGRSRAVPHRRIRGAGQPAVRAPLHSTGANGRYDLNAEGRIVILRRRDLRVLGSFESAGQHFFDVDSRGNIYTCGRFLPEKFVPVNLPVR